ncbi:MAG: acyltransferase [Saprospiraceae bacterium]|nr:acyltransferase [Saprospiraceae bacterium]
MSNPAKKHFSGIDVVRVVAALGVCLYHYSHAVSPKDSWTHWAFQYGYLGVQQFFVVAGMLVPMSLWRRKYALSAFGAMVKKRFWRIEPTVWVSIGAFVVMDIMAVLTGHAHEVKPYSVVGFLLNFTHLNAILGYEWLRDLYWYLAIDWQFYLLCCLALPFISFDNRWARLSVLVVLVAAAFLAPQSIAWLPMYLMPFVVGILLFYHFADLQQLPETVIILAGLLFATYEHSGITHFLSIGLTALIVLFVQHNWAWLTHLSNTTYGLYLTHLFSGWTFISTVLWLLPTANVDILVLVGTALSLLFAQLWYKKIELPLATWAEKITNQ